MFSTLNYLVEIFLTKEFEVIKSIVSLPTLLVYSKSGKTNMFFDLMG